MFVIFIYHQSFIHIALNDLYFSLSFYFIFNLFDISVFNLFI